MKGGESPFSFYMKIAHFSIFSPSQCGLYHTTKDLILGERAVGIDAGFIDFGEKGHRFGMKDGKVEALPLSWADDADIFVRHSAIPNKYHNYGTPIIGAVHGRPENSTRIEMDNGHPIVSGHYHKSTDCRYKRFITFWPEYLNIWETIFKGKMAYVPAMVDLETFKPTDPMLDWDGSPNLLIADIWREDVIPFNPFFAARYFRNYRYQAKIHIVGMNKAYQTPALRFFRELHHRGGLGFVGSQMSDIIKYYSSADIVLTPHVIATRVVREALACGVPIVAGTGCRYTDYTANPMDVEGYAEAIWKCWRDIKADRNAVRDKARATAEQHFDPKASGRAMLRIGNEILGIPKTRRKVFVDIGGHIGESVRRFYREVEDAEKYDIYSFEPDLETFNTLKKTVGHIRNVTLANSAVGFNGLVNFYRGGANQNEGGTTCLNKLRGSVDYSKSTKAKSVQFSQWLRENVSPSDYIVVKINAEGGEYTIMKDLLSANIDYIDKMFIQLHSNKFASPEKEDFQKTEKRFKEQMKLTKLFCYGKKDTPFSA